MTTNTYHKETEDFLAKHGITFSAVHQGEENSALCKGKKNYVFRFTFSRRGKCDFTSVFHGSIAQWEATQPWQIYKKPIPAKLTAYDVLASLTKYIPGTFHDWCDEYGYDTDSRAALRIYKGVCAEWCEVYAFFTPSEIEKMQEIN